MNKNVEIGIYHQNQIIKKILLKEGTHIIGSKKDNPELAWLHLDYPSVSKKHAGLTFEKDQIFIQDFYSKNGTFLEQEKLIPGKNYAWSQDKNLKIGPFLLNFKIVSKSFSKSDEKTDAFHLKKIQYLAENYSAILAQNPKTARNWLTEQTKELPLSENIQERILREFHENGPLNIYWDEKNCKEIIINAYDEVFIDIGQGLQKVQDHFLSLETYKAWVLRIVHQSGGRLDLQHPICDCTLPNGARFHAVLPPIASKQISVAIRKFGSAPIDEYQAFKSGWIDEQALEILKSAVQTKKNILISGGTSTGKTSLLNFLCQYLPQDTRVISVEDTIEIDPKIENLVQLQARHSNAEGKGEISLRELIKSALRMRPDRIIVGECRGAEVIELLQALNTGHPGSMTTLHANSVGEAIHRMELLALLGAANLSLECIREWIHCSIDLVVQVQRDEKGKRVVQEISKQIKNEFQIIYRK